MKGTSETIFPFPFPLGVADLAIKRAYVESAPVGIDGIDLDAGRVVWHSSEVGRPLLAHEAELAVLVPESYQANAFRIALYRPPDIQPSFVSEKVELPEWVSVLSRAKEDFSYQVHLSGDSLSIEWSARSRYKGGAPPPVEIEQAARKNEHGVVQVNMVTGSAASQIIGGRAVPSTETPEVPGLAYKRNYTFQSGPWTVGTKVAVLAGPREPGTGKALLKISEPDRSDQIERFEIDLPHPEPPILSEDGLYLMLEKPTGETGTAVGPRTYELIRTEKASAILEFTETQEIEAFAVLGDRVFYTVSAAASPFAPLAGSRTLRARDLFTGQILWDCERPSRQVRPEQLRP
ncbi:MAG: hypothetical protein HY913_13135 [Desulfomonile tiedjei]|nr:hypothetical protein [Desulfomonile tiedjei]